MKKVKILFYVEHISREMTVIEDIVKECKLSSEEYVICSTDFFMGISKFLYSPELIITPWMYSDFCYKKLLSFPFRKRIKHLNLHHEQITNLDRLEALIPSGSATRGQHIAWGKEFFENLKIIGIPEGDIFITGSMRLKKDNVVNDKLTLSDTYFNDAEIAQKPWVLFVSSYSWKSMNDQMLAKVEKNGRKNVWEYQKLVNSSYRQTLQWIEEFLKQNQNIVYIYRLHPSEEKDELLTVLEMEYSHFRVVSDLPISEWIANADVVDLWISTSLAEVFTMNKPVRVIRPIELPGNVEIIGFESLEKVIDLNDFVNIDASNNYNINAGNDYMDRYYASHLNSATETKVAIEKIFRLPSYDIEMGFLDRIYYSVRESIKDIAKIILFKTGLIRYTRLSRSMKSYFTVKDNAS